MTMPDLTPDELAKACADAMWATDNASKALGITIEEIRAGFARLSMVVREDMLNGQGMAHGGLMFTLADSAFAFACNTYNQHTVAQHCAVTFLAPGHLGDTLTATASERQRATRSGIYDVTIHNQSGETIAEFRGHSRTVKGTHLPAG
ncbi:MAG: hydroxyphenylacetyl-CoA thioesterase PaaI [Pseudomonadota bacterium]